VGSSPTEKELADLVDSKLSCAPAAVEANSTMGCVKRSTARRRSREVMILLHLAAVRRHLPNCIISSSSLGERHCQIRASPVEGHQDAQGLEHQPCKGSLRDGAAPAWRREGFAGTSEQSALATSRSSRRQTQALHSSEWWQEERKHTLS